MMSRKEEGFGTAFCDNRAKVCDREGGGLKMAKICMTSFMNCPHTKTIFYFLYTILMAFRKKSWATTNLNILNNVRVGFETQKFR